jgi:hypothetical protein
MENVSRKILIRFQKHWPTTLTIKPQQTYKTELQKAFKKKDRYFPAEKEIKV